jgi:hypothetical protein
VNSVKVLTRKSSPLAALVALAACFVSTAAAQTAQPPPTAADVHARRAAARRAALGAPCARAGLARPVVPVPRGDRGARRRAPR